LMIQAQGKRQSRRRQKGIPCRTPGLLCPGTAPPGTSCTPPSQRRRCCRSRRRSCPTLPSGPWLHRTCPRCTAWLQRGLMRDKSFPRGRASALASQAADRSCRRGRRCRTGTRRCRWSRSRLSSFRKEQTGLWSSRRRQRDTRRSWAGLTAAAVGLRGTGCRTGRRRPALRRSLADRRRRERRGLGLSRSCLLCRACRRTGLGCPERRQLRMALGTSILLLSRNVPRDKARRLIVLFCFGTSPSCTASNTWNRRWQLSLSESEESWSTA
jgi:hypothetical protein